MLDFIYTDTLDTDDDNVFALFSAAVKYDIPDLKQECQVGVH
jgi:hypothetical protein